MKKNKSPWWILGVYADMIILVILILGHIFNFSYNGNLFFYIFYPAYLVSSFILKINTSFICLGTAVMVGVIGIFVETFIIGVLLNLIFQKIKK
jgi:hypothetical protein